MKIYPQISFEALTNVTCLKSGHLEPQQVLVEECQGHSIMKVTSKVIRLFYVTQSVAKGKTLFILLGDTILETKHSF